MKVLALAFLVALAPAVTFAQRGGGHGGGGGGFHGGGMGGGVRGGAVGGFRGGAVGGFRGNTFVANRGFAGTGFGRFGFGLGFGLGWGWPYWGWGWGWPYWGWGGWGCDPYVFNCWGASWGLGYGDGDGYYGDGSYGSASAYYPSTSGYGGGYAQAPVVINQQYGNPVAPSSGSGYYRNPDYYLIAFTDHTIQAALSYHVEGDTLHYTTMQHEERTAPLSSVDRSFSQQLNRDRRVNFQLP